MGGENWSKEKITKVIAEYGMPPESKFLGYVVHRPESDEFLSAVVDNAYVSSWEWAVTPELAKIYKNHRVAWRVANNYDKGKAVVGQLFDTGPQLFLTLQ